MSAEAPARLRAHHLVCLRLFRGQGYSPAFVENLEATLARARSVGAIVVEGVDDVCVACPGLDGGRCAWAPDSDAEVRRLDALALRLLGCAPLDVIDWAAIEADVLEALPEWDTDACPSCEWRAVCSGTIPSALAAGRFDVR
jgi:hypothetical protein